MKRIKVLIVDDSALIRQMFREILSAEPDIEVVDTASDPLEAREKIKKLNPDVLTLDIEMPKMDGLSFLEKIMTLRPMPVIMVSTLTQKGAEQTIKALEIGAFDTISKPIAHQSRDTLFALKEELTNKIRAAAKSRIGRARTSQSMPGEVISFRAPTVGYKHIIAIGASTGGVEALRDIFLKLPENTPPVVITQHMPEHFTKSFADRLNSISKLQVCEAENHTRLREGCAYMAPGNRHLRIVKISGELVCKIEDSPPVSGHRPSVDVLFQSVAESAGARAVGVILTGMGKDGAEGLLQMRKAGARTIGQDEASCVVYGMPKVAKSIGAVEQEYPLHDIPREMLSLCEKT